MRWQRTFYKNKNNRKIISWVNEKKIETEIIFKYEYVVHLVPINNSNNHSFSILIVFSIHLLVPSLVKSIYSFLLLHTIIHIFCSIIS